MKIRLWQGGLTLHDLTNILFAYNVSSFNSGGLEIFGGNKPTKTAVTTGLDEGIAHVSLRSCL